jgi:hypothetical protein
LTWSFQNICCAFVSLEIQNPQVSHTGFFATFGWLPLTKDSYAPFVGAGCLRRLRKGIVFVLALMVADPYLTLIFDRK